MTSNSLPGDRLELLLQRRPLRQTRLGEARAVDLRALHARCQAFAKHLRDIRRRHHHVGRVDGHRDVGDGRVDLQAEDFAAAGIDGIEVALEAEVDERLEKAAAERVLARRRADDREVPREEDSVQLRRSVHVGGLSARAMLLRFNARQRQYSRGRTWGERGRRLHPSFFTHPSRVDSQTHTTCTPRRYASLSTKARFEH